MIRRVGAAAAAIAVACGLGACSHDRSVACEPTGRYATAETAGPVRIPDDLNPPDETDSLKLPPDSGRAAVRSKPCLESPPGYYAEGAPAAGRNGAAASRPAPGATPRPAAPPPTPPAPTPTPPPAEPQRAEPPPASESAQAEPQSPAESAPAGGDREISN